MPLSNLPTVRHEWARRSRFGLVLGLLLALGACESPKTVPPKAPEPFVPGLALRPTAVVLARGASQAFQAEINYPPEVRYLRQPVLWRVVEPGGGTLTPAGVYTAPATPGTYHVHAMRDDYPNLSAVATVTVK